MILRLMLYAVGVGCALTATAAMIDRIGALRRRPRRGIWAAALGATVLLTMAAPFRTASPAAHFSISAWILPAIGLSPSPRATDGLALERVGWLDRVRIAVDRASDAAPAANTAMGAIWALGSAGVAAVWATGLWALSRRRLCWRDTRLGDVPIFVASHEGPAVVGIWAPRIVMPEWALGLEPPAVDLMLQHEREHQRARDPLLIHAASIGAVAMPWNPAVWWMLSRLKLAVEMDCDARVLARRPGPSDALAYGEVLLAVASRHSGHSLIAPAMLERPSTLRRRIAAMYPHHTGFPVVRLAAAGSAALALLTIALLVPMPGLKAASTPGLPASTPPRAQNGPATTSPAPAPDADKVYGIGEGIAAPVPIDQQDPIYTGEAKRAGIQGEVHLSGIVETTGVLDQIEVTKSLDTVYGLDQAAIDAAKAWRFTPGTKDGRAVPVRVELIMEFRLH